MSDFLESVWFLGDICTNHQQDERVYLQLVQDIQKAGGIPKIQLFSEQTFNRQWPLPTGKYVVSVFRPEDVDWVLKQENRPIALKIASPEAVYNDLLQRCMESQLPLIVSTGGMSEDELIQLGETFMDYDHGVCLMHCMSLYPTPPEQMNLSFIEALADVIDSMWLVGCLGWSCHTPDLEVCKAAVAGTYERDFKYEFHVMPVNVPVITDDVRSSLSVDEFAQLIQWFERCVVPILGSCSMDERQDRENILTWRQRWSDQRN